MNRKWMLALALVVLSSSVAMAGWQVVSDVTTGGGAKELTVNRSIRLIRIECTSGSVIINTVVVREGGAKTPITVAQKLQTGGKWEHDLGGAHQVTGFRISDSGKGTYTVSTHQPW